MLERINDKLKIFHGFVFLFKMILVLKSVQCVSHKFEKAKNNKALTISIT